MKHDTVYAAISAVRADLCEKGIGKDQLNKAQGFKFRGIDDMYNAVSAVLAEHGLTVRTTDIRLVGGMTVRPTKNGSQYHAAALVTLEWAIGPESRYDQVVAAEASDSGDKVMSKLMSMAMKYALLTGLTIPTQGASDDADADSSPERPAEQLASRMANESHVAAMRSAHEPTRPKPAPAKPAWPEGLTATEAPHPDAPGFARIILQSLNEAKAPSDVEAIADHIPDNLMRSLKSAIKEAWERVGK